MAAPAAQPQEQPDSDSDPSLFSCLYFGFASNLSPRTLQQRCPGSLYVGLAVLKRWKFIISEVGFGNIVPGNDDDVVYGTLHFLTAQHEAALDASEEVGWWHVKRKMKVQRLETDRHGALKEIEGKEVETTVYLDVDRTNVGAISKEYLVWIRKAIQDGQQCGVPRRYFDQYMLKYLPDDDSVGQEEKIMMLRTIQMDKENTSQVPSDLLRRVGE